MAVQRHHHIVFRTRPDKWSQSISPPGGWLQYRY